MNQEITFGKLVKERRRLLDLTQAELARRVGCAAITLRKIEADALRPSAQIAERLGMALAIPLEERDVFVRLARLAPLADPSALPLPTPPVMREEIGLKDLSGRAIRGYALGERIGSGGFGAVYRAVQPLVKREVAIKIILPQYADRPEFIRRFETEAQLVARLEHPHIVPLYDYWREPGVAYLVMRLLRGGSLETLLKGSPLAYETVLHLVAQICAGLHVAHRAGIVHRDLKPANILLDDDGNAYLADFGIAKQIGHDKTEETTLEGTVIGSPAYISPEQILAEPVKPQTDIYSLGIMLYELLTGRKPFKGPTPVAFIQQHLNEPLPLLATAQNGGFLSPSAQPARLISSTGHPLPTALDIVIGRATAKEPRDRYPDILSMLADIRRAMTPGASAATLAAGQTAETIPPHLVTMIELPDLENPYKGLRPFGEADAANFFGRETLIQELLARLAELHDPAAGPGRDLARFLAVVGPSGSGKSSVVRAGLIPALRRGGLPGSENWFITEMLPGQHPFAELEAALLRVAVNPPPDLLAHLRQDEQGLLRVTRRILPADEATELVLVIDQFEELFTLAADEDVRRHFLNSLVAAVLDPDSRLRVVITLRADFTDQPLRYVDFGELVRQRTEFVLPLTLDELEQAIVNPTEQAGLSLEAGLAQTIMRDIGDQPGMLPLLQYTLTELFERRQGRLLTLKAYQESGGVLGALARRADELYEGLDEAGQEMARQLFLRLITLGEGIEDTRRRVLRAELEALTTDGRPPTAASSSAESSAVGGQWSAVGSATAIAYVIETFGRYRLLTFDRDPVTRGPTVEVAHEALLREWGRLRGWLSAGRIDIRLQRLLASGAAEWIQANRDPGFLLSGSRLDQFEGWAASTQLALTYEERTFLRTSLAVRRARRAEEETRRRRELETAQKLAETEKARAETEKQRAREHAQAAWRLGWLAVGLAVFLLLAIGGAWFAFNQRNEAQINATRAEENFETSERIRLAAQAQIALDNGEGGDLPALLALRSLQHGYSPEADAALLSALSRGFTRQRYVGHTAEVLRVDFSNDGRHIVTASADGTARLWNTQTGQEIRQFATQALLHVAIFSPDGQTILTGGRDGIARLWDAASGQVIREFKGQTGDLWGVAFAPDGQHIATSDHTTARLWNLQTGEEVRQFIGHTDIIGWVAFSPDGRYLATSGTGTEHTARLWDVQTGQEIRQFVGHTGCACGVVFSPDGRYLLTASDDHTVRVWDVQTGQEIRHFVGHTGSLFDATFSPDGRRVISGSYDKTARLWDVASGKEIKQFIGHTAGVGPVAFSSNGRFVLTGSRDRTARLWDIGAETEPQRIAAALIGYGAGFRAGTLSADDRYVLYGSANGVMSLQEIATGEIVQQLELKKGTINAQALSADGRYLLTGGGDGEARLWELETGLEIGNFSGHTGSIRTVAFAPDDTRLLTGSDDHSARLWDKETGQVLSQFEGHSDAVYAVAFSGDGRFILTGSADTTARLWDAQTGEALKQFKGHTGAIRSVAFSADGQLILTGGEDHTARLWDVETGQEVQQFVGHTDQVLQVAFSADDDYILTGSADQTARLWNVEQGQTVRHFVDHQSAVFFVAFAQDGERVITGDAQSVYFWRKTIEQAKVFACNYLSRDFTAEERTLYNITDDEPTCTEFSDRTVQVEPIWTPVAPSANQANNSLEPLTQVTSEVVELTFVTNANLIRNGRPIQHLFIDAGLVKRPAGEFGEAQLAQPLYRAAEAIEDETNLFKKGEPLDLSLAEWLAATGAGVYTVEDDEAILDFTFTALVPNGTYSLWCRQITLEPEPAMTQMPCARGDVSASQFKADAAGTGTLRLAVDPFPPSTETTVQQIALVYHSEDNLPAEPQFGYNLHNQLTFDFRAEDNERQEVDLLFVNDLAKGSLVQDVFVDANLVVRPQDLEAETLARPLYRSTVKIENDFMEAPFEVGPFEKGDQLDFTLTEWLSAKGQGTYTVKGSWAEVELALENLLPEGVYTVWCSEFLLPPVARINEKPCGAPDGSENIFIADALGRASILLEFDAFPPSTKEKIYVIALAYHSDGQTYGPVPGDHGRNLHIQLIYEFKP